MENGVKEQGHSPRSPIHQTFSDAQDAYGIPMLPLYGSGRKASSTPRYPAAVLSARLGCHRSEAADESSELVRRQRREERRQKRLERRKERERVVSRETARKVAQEKQEVLNILSQDPAQVDMMELMMRKKVIRDQPVAPGEPLSSLERQLTEKQLEFQRLLHEETQGSSTDDLLDEVKKVLRLCSASSSTRARSRHSSRNQSRESHDRRASATFPADAPLPSTGGQPFTGG